MAIVREFKLGETTIKVDDTFFPKTKEENQQRYKEFNRKYIVKKGGLNGWI